MASKLSIRAALAAVALALATPSAFAGHSWGGYHWGRTANPFTLKIGNNTTTSAWDAAFTTSIADWSQSSVLNLVEVTGLANPKTCRPTAGRVEVCNSKYGNNGWLGIASIWLSGGHISQGTVRNNDTYFNTAKYNTPAWRDLVMCQEIGHTFGLDHQDENFNNANLGTCMDYTNDPSTNRHPNKHDYDMLEAIYAHVDSTNSYDSSAATAPADLDMNDPSHWGRLVRVGNGGRTGTYVLDLGQGRRVVTFVIWAEEAHGNRH